MKNTIKKSFLGGLVFLGTVIVGTITYAAITIVSTGDTLTADMWNNRNLPDYDSGWVAADALTTHTDIFSHNFGSIPSNIVIYTSSTNDNSWARLGIGSPSVNGASPESTNVTSNEIKVRFYSGDSFINCSTNVECEDGSTVAIESGYIRVLAWK